jgi:branched-chain amino acid transport system substrate-binding protein
VIAACPTREREAFVFKGKSEMKFARRWVLKSAVAALCAPALAQAQAQAQPAATGAGAPIKLAMIEGLSGPFGNTGEAAFRNLLWAVERVNARGGVRTREGLRPLQLSRYDNKNQAEESVAALRSAIDDGVRIVMQGNSSAAAAALVDAIEKHNEREPGKRVIFLNYAAVDPSLTNERCSFWHFRFDAHSDMRMAALMQLLKDDRSVKSAYLIGQDYSFGQAVLREAKRDLAAQRPDVKIAGEELHPVGRIKDFMPYAAKIKASGAQAVITGNWGNDLTLLVKAAHETGYEGKFYTFYGNALGAPAAIGEAGIGKVIAVADWLPNAPSAASAAFYESFRKRFPNPADDYVHMRMNLMIEALAQAIAKAGSTDAIDVARALETAKVTLAGQTGWMRAADHQFQQPLMVGVMERQGSPGVKFDVEGSGYGFRVAKVIPAAEAEMPHTCRMVRPAAH